MVALVFGLSVLPRANFSIRQPRMSFRTRIIHCIQLLLVSLAFFKTENDKSTFPFRHLKENCNLQNYHLYVTKIPDPFLIYVMSLLAKDVLKSISDIP